MYTGKYAQTYTHSHIHIQHIWVADQVQPPVLINSTVFVHAYIHINIPIHIQTNIYAFGRIDGAKPSKPNFLFAGLFIDKSA